MLFNALNFNAKPLTWWLLPSVTSQTLPSVPLSSGKNLLMLKQDSIRTELFKDLFFNPISHPLASSPWSHDSYPPGEWTHASFRTTINTFSILKMAISIETWNDWQLSRCYKLSDINGHSLETPPPFRLGCGEHSCGIKICVTIHFNHYNSTHSNSWSRSGVKCSVIVKFIAIFCARLYKTWRRASAFRAVSQVVTMSSAKKWRIFSGVGSSLQFQLVVEKWLYKYYTELLSWLISMTSKRIQIRCGKVLWDFSALDSLH